MVITSHRLRELLQALRAGMVTIINSLASSVGGSGARAVPAAAIPQQLAGGPAGNAARASAQRSTPFLSWVQAYQSWKAAIRMMTHGIMPIAPSFMLAGISVMNIW